VQDRIGQSEECLKALQSSSRRHRWTLFAFNSLWSFTLLAIFGTFPRYASLIPHPSSPNPTPPLAHTRARAPQLHAHIQPTFPGGTIRPSAHVHFALCSLSHGAAFAAVISIVKMVGLVHSLVRAYELNATSAAPEAPASEKAAALRGWAVLSDGVSFGLQTGRSLGAAAFAWSSVWAGALSRLRAEATGYSWHSTAQVWSLVQPYLQISCMAPSLAWEAALNGSD
jgi:hypothetical protein